MTDRMLTLDDIKKALESVQQDPMMLRILRADRVEVKVNKYLPNPELIYSMEFPLTEGIIDPKYREKNPQTVWLLVAPEHEAKIEKMVRDLRGENI